MNISIMIVIINRLINLIIESNLLFDSIFPIIISWIILSTGISITTLHLQLRYWFVEVVAVYLFLHLNLFMTQYQFISGNRSILIDK